MAKSVKLADIAKELGVSTVTVSNALLGKKGVSDRMRELIWKKAQEMGYVKSSVLAAQQELAGHFRIGVLISEKYLDNNYSFYWQMYQYLAALISKNGHVTILEIVSTEDEERAELPRILPTEKLDGIIVIGGMETDYLMTISSKISLPGLCLGFYLPELKWDSVEADDFAGMHRLTSYVIEKGNQELAFVGRILTADGKMNRYMGFSKALLEHGIETNGQLMFLESDMEIEQAAVSLAKKLPDAAICVDDQTAEQLIAVLQKLGLSVPEHISVTGYDDFCFDWAIHDHLTTYGVDAKTMSEVALSILTKRIRGNASKKCVRTVEGKLIERDSVKRKEADT